MILYFGTNGRLLETVTEYELASGAKSFITSSGNISSNKIFAYFEGEEPTILQASVTYLLPNGSVFENSSIPADAIVEDSILLDLNRDLTYFKYGKTYRFVEFDLPAALLTTGGAGVYQANFTLYPSTDQARAYGDFSFKAEGSPSQLVENEITDTQYQLILARFSNCVPYTGASANVNLGNYSLTANSVNLRSGIYTCSLDVSDSGEPFVGTYANGNNIVWVFSVDETGVKTIATRQWVSNQGYATEEWATSQFLTETAGDAKYLPLTGGTVTGSLKLTSSLKFSKTLENSNYEWEFGVNPYGGFPSTFELANNTINERFVFKPSSGNVTRYVATEEWVQGLLTPNAVGSATTSANVNGYNGAQFTIGDNNGLYFFTYGNCSVMIPVYGLVAGTEYKIASALNGGGQAGFQVKVLTYRLTGDGDLQIYQKENFIPTGYTAYLMRIKLY